MHIQIQGGIYTNRIIGTNIAVDNVTIDAYNSPFGFIYVTECNFPEASGENEIVFNNLHVYNSRTRITLLTNDFISNMGNANLTIAHSTFEVYGDISNMYSAITLMTNPL